MPQDSPLFERIIEGLYEAAFDPTAWPTVWDQIAKWLDAASSTLFVEDRPSGEVDVLALPGWPEKAQALYANHYGAVDPYANFGRRTALSLQAILGQDIISAADYERSEIWNDLGRQYMDAYHFLSAFLPIGPHIAGMIGFHRPRDASPFETNEQTQLGRLLPHVQRALQLGRRIAAERQQSAMHSATLEALSLAVIVVTADAELVFANQAAEHLARRTGFVLPGRGRRVQAQNREEDARLRSLIAEAANGGSGGSLFLTFSGARRLAVLISRLPRLMGHLCLERPTDHRLALLTIRDLAVPLGDSTANLASLFGLTGAEQSVLAHLLAGLTVEEIAQTRRASPLTVRSQIRHLLLKLDARNLRDVMRIALSVG